MQKFHHFEMSPLCVVLCKSHECVCVSKLDPPSFGNITLLDLVFLDYNNLYPYVCFCAVAFSLPSKTFILSRQFSCRFWKK